MARKLKLERIEATDEQFSGMSKEQLLLDGTQGAKDELYRRSFNKLVKSQQA